MSKKYDDQGDKLDPPSSSQIMHSRENGNTANYDGPALINQLGQMMNHILSAAVHTRHTVNYKDVPLEPSKPIRPTVVEVVASPAPLNILFRSSSSALNVQQNHESEPGSVQESNSEDEPHRLIHSVVKPVIQEVYEMITPFRKITQEIHPVQEDVQTIIARDANGETDKVTHNEQANILGKYSSTSPHKPHQDKHGQLNSPSGNIHNQHGELSANTYREDVDLQSRGLSHFMPRKQKLFH